jgi:alanyl-tRNA synthetase
MRQSRQVASALAQGEAGRHDGDPTTEKMNVLSAKLREGFLDYFAKNGHTVVPSAPLVPRHDPTLMFVNAGMVQFKDVFTGKETRPYTRAASSQKCIRISGKHNDLENVGVTARHHTFFEMLGNFSFGDYFKEEAIVLAWELLTREWQIDTSRLVVTVFDGEGGFSPDDEAAAIWKKVAGLSDERILRMGAADNFWSMGDTGPCGPCSEIHYFHGDEPDLARFGEEPDSRGHGWTEIWNLVFMQYDRPEKGAAPIPLPAPCVDTGAGLERMAGVLQGASSNYDTDIMRRLVEVTAEIAKKKYGASASDDDVSLRVVADHARTTAFLIAEGVTPDRQKREYVLRRVMRRAIRHGHRLGIDEPFLHRVALEVVALMGQSYPELAERRELIEKVSEGEETRFRQTLRRGIRILDDRFAELESRNEKALSAEIAADLYTTYGFPLDLTEVIAREQGYDVDLKGARRIVKSAEESEGAIDPTAALDPAHRKLAAELAAVTFTGYEREQGESTVQGLIRIGKSGERQLVDSAHQGDDVEVAVASTPFYAESGGQVGDQGAIIGKRGLSLNVIDTHKPLEGLVLHRGVVTEGTLSVGDEVTLVVDRARRGATRRNHSATHLLHWALKKVLGEHAQQKGSLVGPDVLRFDFAHNQPLTREEIERVEDLVNAKILTNAPVETEVLPIAAAREKGAVAIFEEKYGSTVRVLTMTPDSVELCGGTHCQRLGDIGMFTIVGEGGTAAGVRRIFAATGDNALAHLRSLKHELDRARAAAKAQTAGDLAGKIEKIVQSERKLEKRVKELEKQLAEGGGGGGLEAMLAEARTIGDARVLGAELPEGTNMAALRELAEKLRDKLGERSVVLLAARNADKAQLALVVSKSATDKLQAGRLIKGVSALVGGSGGGRPDMAQAGGTNVAGIGAAVAAIYDEVAAALR